jgi:hypothetical protein
MRNVSFIETGFSDQKNFIVVRHSPTNNGVRAKINFVHKVI